MSNKRVASRSNVWATGEQIRSDSKKSSLTFFIFLEFFTYKFRKTILFPKNIEIQDSKMVSHVYIVLKMNPTYAITIKNNNCHFTNFVKFFIGQSHLAQKIHERVGIAS